MDPTDSPILAEMPDQKAIRRQLDLLLTHNAFRKSARCTRLLRHLVERTLEDPQFHPKERTLAVDVFDRSPDYDTAADPIVRTTANEIRKRLGSYFHETGPAEEVYIDLPSGSYRPVFRSAVPRAAVQDAPVERKNGLGRAFPAVCLVGAVILLAGGLAWRHWPQSNADRFWRPFMSSSLRVLVCPPAPEAAKISVSDSKAVWRVLSVLDQRQGMTLVRSSDQIRGNELHDGPAIVIGGLNNPWSAELISHLRFQIASDDTTHRSWITDQMSPGDRKWSVDISDLAKDNSRSYALISRTTDSATRNPEMNVAGVGMYATAAAGEFIAYPGYLNALGKSLRGCDENLQLVLSAEAINGVVSERKVEAIHCW